MANMNSVNGYFNVPAQTITVSTAVALLVPASGYPNLPSPVLVKNSGLSVAPPPDVTSSMGFDGHPFIVRVSGIYSTGTSATFRSSLAQVSAANVGVIGAAGGVTSTGALGTGATVIGAGTVGTAVSGKGNFTLEAHLMWDSADKQLNGTFGGAASFVGADAGAVTFTPITVITTVASLNLADLNFLATFTFSAANASNSVTVNEFLVDRA